MRKAILICSALFLILLAPSSAQEPGNTQQPAKATETPAHYYHLQFVVQELNEQGKPTNSRTYTTTVSTGPQESPSSIRSGSRIPFVTGTYPKGQDQAMINAQLQFIDVGVNIDCRHTREAGRQLSMDVTADVSSAANASDPNLHQPIIRQNKWQSTVLIPIGKPTAVFTSDSLDNKSSMQLIVTATLID